MANIISASMPAGQFLTGPIGLGSTPVVLIMPSGWDNPILLTIQISPDGGATWCDVYKSDGTEYTCPVIPGTMMIFEKNLQWVSMVRFRSGSGRSPIPQSQTRNFQMILYP